LSHRPGLSQLRMGRQFGLRAKIMSGYVLITILALLIATYSTASFLRFSATLNAMMVQNYVSVLASSNMIASVERQDSWALLVLSGDERAAGSYEQARADFLGWLARAEDNVTLTGEGDLVKRIREAYLAYTGKLDELMGQTSRGLFPVSELGERYREVILPAFTDVRAGSQELLGINNDAMRLTQEQMTTATSRAVWSMAGAALAALLTAVVLGFTVSEMIARPVMRLSEAARRVGEGRLDEPIPAGGGDEVGQLSDAFSSMVANLRELRAIDVAEVVASRSRLAAVIDGISDGIVVTDSDYVVGLINPVAVRALGVDPSGAVGRPLSCSVDDPRVLSVIEQNMENPDGSAEPVLIDRIAEGKRRFYLAEMTSVRSQGGLVGRVLLLRDITAAEEGERVKSQFMSAVSHELRTPLTSITMGIGLLAESKDILKNQRERDLVDILVADSRRLSRLVDDLFEVAKLQKGQLPLTFSQVDVAGLVSTVVKPFTQQAEALGINLEAELPAGLPPVRADAEKLAWVLSNLIGNALRYTPAGGGITISAQRHASKLYVSVTDTGKGIPRERHEEIFEPYVQVSEDRKGGAGLGLSISRDLIRAHGGRIWVESEPGKGSTFTFSLSIDG